MRTGTPRSLLVVGSVAYDDLEMPDGTTQRRLLGGSATHFSIAALPFVKARLVGVVGRDFTQRDRETLSTRGIDLKGLAINDDGDTFSWGGRYSENMDDRTSIFTHLGVFEQFRPVLPDRWNESEMVFLGNIDPSLQLEVLSKMHNPHMVAMDTMDHWINGSKRDQLLQVISQVNALFVSKEEARALTGKRRIIEMGPELLRLGPTTIIVKDGEHGAHLFANGFTKSMHFYVPAFPLENVVDPTGAGDSFAGGFMGQLALSHDSSPDGLRRAMVMGSIMASFCVEGFGIEQTLCVEHSDVRERFRTFVEHTRFNQ